MNIKENVEKQTLKQLNNEFTDNLIDIKHLFKTLDNDLDTLEFDLEEGMPYQSLKIRIENTFSKIYKSNLTKEERYQLHSYKMKFNNLIDYAINNTYKG